MSKKDKYAKDYEQIQREIVRNKINEIFKKDPVNYRDGLEEIGFTWYDDDYPSEEDEETSAVPENDNQQKLINYFESKAEFSESLLGLLHTERHSEKPNYPLIRKYFRAGNLHLKKLLLYGLAQDPINLEHLSDLAFFHEFNNILPELVEHFTEACQLETDLQKFSELAQDFFYAVAEDGYDALLVLRNLFDMESDKRKIIDFLINKVKSNDQGAMQF